MEVQQIVCVQCDKPEEQCQCDRYCLFCQSTYAIRLCTDGQYYCPECREACDISPAKSDRYQAG